MPQVLDYPRPPDEPRRMVLERTADGAVLVFPVAPRWVYWLDIVWPLIFAGVYVGFIGALVRVFWSIARTGPAVFLPWMTWFGLILVQGAPVLIGGVAGLHALIQYRRWGRVPTRLGFDGRNLIRTGKGWRGIAQRRWPLEDVTEVRFTRLKSLFPSHPAADLRIRVRRRWVPLYFRVSGYKVDIVRQFAQELERAVARASGRIEPTQGAERM